MLPIHRGEEAYSFHFAKEKVSILLHHGLRVGATRHL